MRFKSKKQGKMEDNPGRDTIPKKSQRKEDLRGK
jgi:hypothetical protein